MAGAVEEWAKPPQTTVILNVYKDGGCIETVNASTKPVHVLGRNSDSCDIVLAHESVSRQHAAIAQDEAGAVFIVDLRSSQGTFLNGVKIMPNKQRPLKDGDELRFAASTRVYKVSITAPSTGRPQPMPVLSPPPVDTAESDSSDEETEPDNQTDVPVSGFGKQTAVKTVEDAHADNIRKFEAPAKPAKRKLTIAPIVPRIAAAESAASTDSEAVAASRPPQEPGDSDESGSEENEETEMTEEQRMAALREYARSIGLPVSHEIALQCHIKTVTAIATDRSGARLATGSNDYNVRLFDFAGMDRSHRSFKTFSPKEDHVVVAISFSPSGDRFVVATGSAQPMVFDHDGNRLATFVKGDPYIMDMYHTHGHNALVTGAQWHPSNPNVVISCGNDGTVRVWDLTTKRLTFDDEIKNAQVARVKNAGGTRLPVTCCSYSPNARHIVCGGEDGSLHFWNVRASGNYPPKPDGLIREAHSGSVTSIVFRLPVEGQSASTVFATRSLDHTIKLWDVTKFKLPLAIVTDVATLWPTTNVAFSPDGSLMIAGTAIKRSGKSTKPPKAASGDQSDSEPEELSSEFGHLKAFNLDALLKSGSCSVEDAVYSLQVCKDAVVCLNWHPLTKQIVAGCGDGVTRVFYDPTITEKGAMLSAARAPARRGLGDFVADFSTVAFTAEEAPHLIRDLPRKRVKKDVKKEAMLTKKPELPDLAALKKQGGSSFTQYLMQSKITAKSNIREQDPRAELLKYAEAAKGGGWVGRAYAGNQPVNVLADKTLEEEAEEEAKAKEKPADVLAAQRRQ